MSKTLGLAAVLVCFGWASAAHAYLLVEVQSGGVIVVEKEGQELALEVAGVWVPEPSTLGKKGQYRGAEAQKYVDHLLRTMPVYIREVAPRRRVEDGVRVRARIRLGEDGEFDLAVSLAHAGLALVDRAAATDVEYLNAIHEAERLARRSLAGMHDGGFHVFARGREQLEMSFGAGNLAVTPGRRETDLQAYTGDRLDSSAEDERRPMRSAIEAIRDWGGSMGLPPDASRRGW